MKHLIIYFSSLLKIEIDSTVLILSISHPECLHKVRITKIMLYSQIVINIISLIKN